MSSKSSCHGRQDVYKRQVPYGGYGTGRQRNDGNRYSARKACLTDRRYHRPVSYTNLNVSVPFGITTPDKPHISSTRWRSVSDQKNKVYYVESTLTPNLFWLDLKKIDCSPNAGIKKLSLTNGEIYAGDAIKDLKDSKGFVFLFQTPVM